MTKSLPLSRNGRPAASPYQNSDDDVYVDATPNQANTSKRRLELIDFRSTQTTPSRVSRIKNMFEEVVDNLVSTPPPSGYTIRHIDVLASPTNEANKQRVRLSVHKGNSDYLIDSARLSSKLSLPSLRSPISTKGHDLLKAISASKTKKQSRDVLSNGRNTPSRIPRLKVSPRKVALHPGYTYGEDSSDEDMHSTHGVPLVLPIHESGRNPLFTQTNVTKWLDSVEDGLDKNLDSCAGFSEKKATKVKAGKKKDADKENVSPVLQQDLNSDLRESSMNLPVHADNLMFQPASIGRPCRGGILTAHHTYAPHSSKERGTPPTGLLSVPPRRMGLTPGKAVSSKLPTKKPQSGSKTQFVNDPRIEQVSEACGEDLEQSVIVLSPSVTRYRKGRGDNTGTSRDKSRRHDKKDELDQTKLELVRALEDLELEDQPRRGRRTYRV